MARGFKAANPPVVDYLWRVNDEINRLKVPYDGSRFGSGGLKQGKVKRTGDVKRLLSPSEMMRAAPFFDQLRASNDNLGGKQVQLCG